MRGLVTVGGNTLLSRIFGFLRDILIASAIGTGPAADAFFAAFRFPNLFRRLFAEGAFNTAFVPLYSGRLATAGPEAARLFAGQILSVLLVTLFVLTIGIEAAMPWLMAVLAPGFLADPVKYDLAVKLTQICFPYLVFISAAAALSGILNSHKRFAVAAASPTLLNIVLILFLLFGVPYFPGAAHALSWGVMAAGALQFATLAWACAREGALPRLPLPRLTPDVRRLFQLGVPGLISGGITQINIVIGTVIASLEAGAVAYLYYADRVYQLPLGMIGIALGVVLLPELSRRLSRGDPSGANWTQNRAIEIGAWLTLPAAVALIVVPIPVVDTLFARGAFTAEDTRKTALALSVFAAGLPAFVLLRVFQAGFFAREDTWTPMVFSLWAIGANIVIGVGLFPLIGALSVAVGTSVAGWLNLIQLWVRLRRLGHFSGDARLKSRLPRILAATAGMGAALVLAAIPLNPAFGASGWDDIIALCALVFLGLATFVGLSQLFGALRLSELRESLAGRKA